MDSHRRLFAKAVTWQVMGFVVMLVIGWLFTGSVSAGGGIAVAGAVTGFCGYYLHEFVWSKIRWGRVFGPGTLIEAEHESSTTGRVGLPFHDFASRGGMS